MLSFRVAVALAAFLGFSLQPLVARRLLPWFGGAPAVWTACLLFFQTMLLAGYAYAHAMAARPRPWLHRGLLLASLVFLPLGPERPVYFEPPSLRILWLLVRTVGLPYLLLAATSPLVQRWAPTGTPYRLYAWSNGAALLALVAYPFALEPVLTVATQMRWWSVVYVVFVAVAWSTTRPVGQGSAAARPPLTSLAGWALLAAAPSALLLATTNQLCREVAATPFLWVLPLALYLLSWILTFERDRWYHRTGFAVLAGVAAPAAAGVLMLGLEAPLWSHVVIDSLALLTGAVLCHGELARSRPDPQHLTGFYLAAAAGGALGGAWVGAVAPRVFLSYTEFPIALAACAGAAVAAWLRVRYRPPMVAWAALFTAVLTPLATLADQPRGDLLAARRNFYGILRVTERGDRRVLNHGRVMHGSQFVDWKKRSWPTTYYGRESAVGQVLDRHHPQRVGVIGLGTGTVAAYGRAGDVFRFYEINPAVVELARQYFTFLADSPATIEVALGDARLVLEREEPQQFDVLVVDAFSSDAIPAHLLTAECSAVFRRHLRPEGLLLFHISNQALDLWPVTRGLAVRLGWPARRFTTAGDDKQGTNRATWVVMPSSSGATAEPAPLVWTDDFVSLWSVRARR
jgi:hypothetical protein